MKRKLEIIGLIVAWLSVLVQFILMIQNRVANLPETLIRFFSFFTILTNTLVALYFTVKVFNIQKTSFRYLQKDPAVTAITVFILIVGIVYQIVLRAIWEPTGIQKIVDELLHTIIPLYFFIYWIISLKEITLRIRPVLKWSIYPGVYITFIMIRGYYSGYYPYPFLDVGEIGLQNVIWSILIILGSMVLLMYLLTILGKFIKKKNMRVN